VRPTRSLTLVTAPASEPVSLAEAKAWAKIDAGDDDPLVAALIAAAREAAENYLRRSLISQTWKLTQDLPPGQSADCLGEGVYDLPATILDGDLPRAFKLPRGPVQSVSSVVTYDTDNDSSTYASSNYYVDTAGDRLVLNENAVWPAPLRPRAAIAITYVAGYGDSSGSIPQAIRTAMLMHIQRMYDGRIVCDMPEGCQRLYRPYRLLGELYA
jgi:hypothetical protein